ncbi:MAG TPA: peptide deformylase [Actinomycetota bacterium]|nr:peptide deformylase [Actinomycetota bacterium]
MAILEIRKFGDPALREKASQIDKVSDLHTRLIADMLETMRAAPGVGLAGPQVGVLEQIFVWEVGDEHGAVLNPVITFASEEKVEGEEGCLSLPGLYYPVMRSHAVRVEGLDERGEPVKLEAEDFMARVCQHEIDHLNGVLFIDHLPDELRKQALTILREQALGLPPSVPGHPSSHTDGSDTF